MIRSDNHERVNSGRHYSRRAFHGRRWVAETRTSNVVGETSPFSVIDLFDQFSMSANARPAAERFTSGNALWPVSAVAEKRTAGAFGSGCSYGLATLQLRAIKTSSLFDWPVASRNSFSRLFSCLEGAITIPLVPAPLQISARKYWPAT